MKRFSFLICGVAVLAANAEPATTSESLETRTIRRVLETPPSLNEKKPNEIKAGKVSYSGIAIEIVKIGNPLELINPAAPVEYGLAEASVLREPGGGRISGLKIFSIEF